MKRYFGIAVLIFFFLICLIPFCRSYADIVAADALSRQHCEEYERSKIIPAGSCNCTDKLFDHFSYSYDWMDACKIVEAKERSK